MAGLMGAALIAVLCLSGCSGLTPNERKSDINTVVICFMAQCITNETDKAANMNEVEGSLTNNEMQQLENRIEATVEAEIEADLIP